ncbi:MAG: cytochrome c biogenesis CcdA family protein [Acidimicrobiales bacterium]
MALVLACLALYGAGLTSTLSPCVLPLVPGYIGVLGDGGAGQSGRRPRIAAFVVGAGVTFVLLGGAAATVGAGVADAVGWSQRVAGVGLVVLGGLMILGRRGLLVTEIRLVRRLPDQPHLRALLLGIGCGAAWSPCVGPLLGVALTAAGGAGSVARGSLLLAWFAFGVLTPFLAFSFVPTRSSPRLAGAGRRLGTVASATTILFGVVLAAGWYGDVVARLSL